MYSALDRTSIIIKGSTLTISLLYQESIKFLKILILRGTIYNTTGSYKISKEKKSLSSKILTRNREYITLKWT